MWDSGIGRCVGCGQEADRDILGRCMPCFQSGFIPMYGSFKEVGVENPYDKQGSTAHVKDIKKRRLDVKTGKMYYHQEPKTYFFPKGS
jgi:hypothetical protein